MRNLFVAALFLAMAPCVVASQTPGNGLDALAADATAVLSEAAEPECTATATDEPVLETVADLDAALAAVAAILDPALMSARNACLARLGETRRTILIEAAGAR